MVKEASHGWACSSFSVTPIPSSLFLSHRPIFWSVAIFPSTNVLGYFSIRGCCYLSVSAYESTRSSFAITYSVCFDADTFSDRSHFCHPSLSSTFMQCVSTIMPLLGGDDMQRRLTTASKAFAWRIALHCLGCIIQSTSFQTWIMPRESSGIYGFKLPCRCTVSCVLHVQM